MRRLFVLAFALTSFAAQAQQTTQQQPAPAKGWNAVRALPPGAALDIKLRKASQKCAFRSADADTLTCNRGTDLALQRADILQIKVHHRGRSTLSGLAIGAGTGAIIGIATVKPCGNAYICVVGRGTAATVLGVGGGAIGALTGYLSDFTHSTVYKAK